MLSHKRPRILRSRLLMFKAFLRDCVGVLISVLGCVLCHCPQFLWFLFCWGGMLVSSGWLGWLCMYSGSTEFSIVWVLWEYFGSTVPVLCQYCASTVTVLCQYCASTVLVLCLYCVSTGPVLCQYCASTVPVLCKDRKSVV